MDNLEKEIVEFLLGKKDTITKYDPFPIMPFYQLAVLTSQVKLDKKNSEYLKFKNKYELSEYDIGILTDEYNAVLHYGNCKIIQLLRSCKELYFHGLISFGGVTNTIIPNVSDNIIQNLFDIMYTLDVLNRNKKRKEEQKDFKWIRDRQDRMREKFNNTVVTVRKSLLSNVSVFDTYAKHSQKQLGLYSLFIPDNSLENGEILIPHPKQIKKNINISKIDNVRILIDKERKIVILDDAPDKTKEMLQNNMYKGYKIVIGNGLIDNYKTYPAIGDYILATRHPIITLILRCKVVGYTDDGSIRANSKTTLALLGDADGDSWSISWSKWSESLEFATSDDVDEYCRIAGIEMKYSEYNNNYDINHFMNLKPDTDKDCFESSSQTGLEQAEAKLKTKELTGLFGCVDRDMIQTLIINNKEVDHEILHDKHFVSQMLVQLKNILSDLSNGELSQEFKDTFVSINQFYGIKRTRVLLARLLDKRVEEAEDMLITWLGVKEEDDYFENEEEETTEEDLYNQTILEVINM